jgi:hypothetical protein
MDDSDEISIHLFCHSLDSLLRLLLRLMKVLLKYGLLGHGLRTASTDLMVLLSFCDFF